MPRLLLLTIAIGAVSLSAQNIVEQDAAYGLVIHNQIASRSQFVPPEQIVPVLKEVFQRMASTPTALSSGQDQTLFYVNDASVNASAGAGGRLYVHDGLIAAVGPDAGILAFVIGHEMAHNIRHHGLLKYLRTIQEEQQLAVYKARIRAGDNKAGWEELAYVATVKITNAKMDRDQENEADKLGLMMAAEAGYHPSFAIVAARKLREKVGEQSKFGAFFSDHPRWTTREERAEQNYDQALEVFSSRWDDIATSPGGSPPLLVSAQSPLISKKGNSYVLTVPFLIRNLTPTEHVTVSLIENGEQNSDPVAIGARWFSASGQLSETLPGDFFKTRKGHQWVNLRVQAEDGRILFETASSVIR